MASKAAISIRMGPEHQRKEMKDAKLEQRRTMHILRRRDDLCWNDVRDGKLLLHAALQGLYIGKSQAGSGHVGVEC
jgi:hypothetical protein